MRLCSPALDATKLCTAPEWPSWTRNPQFVASKAGNCHQTHFLSSLFDFAGCSSTAWQGTQAQQFLQSVSVLLFLFRLFASITAMMVISSNASSWANGIKRACSPSFCVRTRSSARRVCVCSLERVQQSRIVEADMPACCLGGQSWAGFLFPVGRSTSGGTVHYCLVPINSAKFSTAALASSCTNLGTHGMLMLQKLGTWDYACMAADSGFRHLPHRGPAESLIVL
jgi:hypothetical protein